MKKEKALDKPALREQCWAALERVGAARFPGARGRIPNFVGAEEAARRLAETEVWKRARRLKSNPDSAQRPVRYAALKAEKALYMAVPRLAQARPFLELDPGKLPKKKLWFASSIRGASQLGRPVTLRQMAPIDLIVTGCVAVTREGTRLGKGGGYSDLEYALLREHGLVTEETPIATTVHPVQVLPRGAIPMTHHDISLDLMATPEEVIGCLRRPRRPAGILWEELEPEKRRAIPALRGRKEGQTR